MKEVVKSCQICKQIDPAPVGWEHSHLSVDKNWCRLVADVTYVVGKPYLTVIDCGPSRFAVWMQMANETAEHAIKLLNRIFLERGPPEELLCDYGPCFKSCKRRSFAVLQSWGVSLVFCCAYRHSGIGIIERNHKTIKRMVARSGKRAVEMVYWYNNIPNKNNVVPSSSLYRYEIRLPGEPSQTDRPGDSRR